MIRPRVFLALFAGVLASPAIAAPTSVPYSLVVPASEYEVGCQGPCACPVYPQPTYGSFELRFISSDPLYSYYAVDRYIASFNNGPGAVSITGSGQYRIGGEFAITQQMTLDLQVWGGPVQHFDSGVVPANVAFPGIRVSCAVHEFYCYDTILVVDAKPIDTEGVPPGRLAGIETVRPNPFAHATEIVLAMARPGPVELALFDLDGRRVRRIDVPESAALSPRVVIWDGRRDDGREAPAGVYWVLARWAGGADGRRIVKVD